MSNIKEDVFKFLLPIVTKLGYELVQVEYGKKHSGMNLTVFIDAPEGITLNDCEKVHKAINLPLDELDPTNGGGYTLNVSSPGLDRPIKTDSDLSRNKNKEVEINLYTKLNGNKNIQGTLSDFDEDNVVITTNKGNITIKRSAVSKMIKKIDF